MQISKSYHEWVLFSCLKTPVVFFDFFVVLPLFFALIFDGIQHPSWLKIPIAVVVGVFMIIGEIRTRVGRDKFGKVNEYSYVFSSNLLLLLLIIYFIAALFSYSDEGASRLLILSALIASKLDFKLSLILEVLRLKYSGRRFIDSYSNQFNGSK